jgi:hypothetical protein
MAARHSDQMVVTNRVCDEPLGEYGGRVVVCVHIYVCVCVDVCDSNVIAHARSEVAQCTGPSQYVSLGLYGVTTQPIFLV